MVTLPSLATSTWTLGFLRWVKLSTGVTAKVGR